MSKFLMNGKIAGVKDFWCPGKFVDDITPLFGHSRAGICRRPVVSQDILIEVANICIAAHAENNEEDKFGVDFYPKFARTIKTMWKPSCAEHHTRVT